MIFNLLKLRWPKKEIAKMKTQTKSRKIKCRKTRPQLQVKGKLTTTAVVNIRPRRPRLDNVLKNNGGDENTEKKNRGSCMTSITMIQSTQKAMKNILKIFANF